MNKYKKEAMEHYDNAIKHYGRAIELKPNFAEAYLGRGTVWLHKKAWDKAKSDFKAAKENELDIAKRFSNDYGGVSAFEKQYRIRLPKDIKDMLTA